jgi:hypothetical protein
MGSTQTVSNGSKHNPAPPPLLELQTQPGAYAVEYNTVRVNGRLHHIGVGRIHR